MRLRVVSWNVDARPTASMDAKIDLLRRLQPDVALLQEIGRSVYRGLMPHPSAHQRMHRGDRLFTWGALSTDLSTPRGSEFRLGCAVLGRSTTALMDSYVLSRAPFDVAAGARAGFLTRTVGTRLALATGDMLTVCSFHGRRSSIGPAEVLQRAFHNGLATWLAGERGPIVFGIDAGQTDRSDPLLGADHKHNLRPVARLGREHIWATSELDAVDVDLLTDDAETAGSDHALLVADLALRPHSASGC